MHIHLRKIRKNDFNSTQEQKNIRLYIIGHTHQELHDIGTDLAYLSYSSYNDFWTFSNLKRRNWIYISEYINIE